METTKNITIAAVKDFIRQNKIEELYISTTHIFDAKGDGIVLSKDKEFTKAQPTKKEFENMYNVGIQGVIILPSGSSENTFNHYNDGVYQGYYISNRCRSFAIAKKINQ